LCSVFVEAGLQARLILGCIQGTARGAGLAAGYGGIDEQEIARALGVAVSTVERHLANLYTKIAARGRADAIAYTLHHRLYSRSSG
jgi:hypothetical protein